MLLSRTGKVLLLNEPVSGRFGLPRLFAKLCSHAADWGWNGEDEFTIVCFNKRHTICKILHVDETGVDCTSRILHQGTFKVFLDEGLIPRALTRYELERLLLDGTLEGPLQHGNVAKKLESFFSSQSKVA